MREPMDTLRQDLRFAGRAMLGRPLVSGVTPAVASGANAAPAIAPRCE